MKLDKYPYKGWDWTEVGYALNIPHMDDNPFYQAYMSKGPDIADFDNWEDYWKVRTPLTDKDLWLMENEDLYFKCYLEMLMRYVEGTANRKRYTVRWAVKNIKEYLAKLAVEEEEISYSAPLWRGLIQIESDEMFIQYYYKLFTCAWS